MIHSPYQIESGRIGIFGNKMCTCSKFWQTECEVQPRVLWDNFNDGDNAFKSKQAVAH